MFKQLYDMIPSDKFDISMVISKPFAGKLRVSVLPRGEDLNLKPLVISGTPEELDEGLADELTKAKEMTSGLVSNLAQYQELVNTKNDEVKKKTVKAKPAAAASAKVEAKPSAQQPMF